MVNALRIQKPDSGVHVLPLIAGHQIPVKGVEIPAGFLLPIADDCGQQCLNVHQLQGPAIGQDTQPTGPGVLLKPHLAPTEGRVNIRLEQIQRLDEMAVAINDRHGSPPRLLAGLQG